MKLSIGMIAEVLNDLEPFCDFQHFDRQLNLEHCIFYDGDHKLRADTVYLFTEEIAEKHPLVSLAAEDGTAVICLGSREDYKISPQAAFICISPEKISAANLSNRVQRCFERYWKIDAALREAVQGPDDMMALTRLATPLFFRSRRQMRSGACRSEPGRIFSIAVIIRDAPPGILRRDARFRVSLLIWRCAPGRTLYWDSKAGRRSDKRATEAMAVHGKCDK